MTAQIRGLRCLERQPQRELDQPRRSRRRDNPPERTANGFDVVDRWIRKARVVPDVEEVRSEVQVHAFRQLERLQEREIPVLLIRSTKCIASKVTEVCHSTISTLSRR